MHALMCLKGSVRLTGAGVLGSLLIWVPGSKLGSSERTAALLTIEPFVQPHKARFSCIKRFNGVKGQGE